MNRAMTTNVDPAEFAEQVAHELMGTCDSLYEALERHGREDMESNDQFCARLDSMAFCCEQCNWWFEISEMTDKSDRWVCETCDDD